MTMMDVRPADLTELTDQELALAYCDDGADIGALQAEEDRREQARRRSQGARYARWDRQREWYDAAHEQFLRAERELNGVMLNRRGVARGIDPFALWSGPWHMAEPYMSWELLRWFEVPGNTRITVTEYERQQRHERTAEHDQVDRDESDAVRRDTGAGEEGAGDRGDGRRNAVPGPDARAEDAEADPGARADGRGSSPVQPVIVLTEESPVTVIPGPDPVEAARARLARRAAELAAERAGRPVAVPAMSVPVPEPVSPAAVAVRPAGTVVAARQEIDGDQVLRYLFTFLKRFALWGSDAEVVTAALWVAQAHARDGDGMPVWQYCARLGIFGPSGSGKSWKSRLIGKLAPAGEILLEPTKPSFIDMVADRNTVIITEADELFYTSGRNRGILAVVNASYEPDRTNTRKQGGKVVKVTLFGHVVLDGLDVMLQATRPDLRTMISRTICMMSAAGPEGYRPPRFDRQARGIAGMLGQRTAAWMAQEVADGMADDVPQVPEHLGNRPFALWEPLFTVAARADRAIARREGTDENEPGPWWLACAEACEVLEAGAPVIDESDDDDMSELDRAMADWAGAA